MKKLSTFGTLAFTGLALITLMSGNVFAQEVIGAASALGADALTALTTHPEPPTPLWSSKNWVVLLVAILVALQYWRKNEKALLKLWHQFKNPGVAQQEEENLQAASDGKSPDESVASQSHPMRDGVASGLAFFLKGQKASQKPIKWLVVIAGLLFVALAVAPVIVGIISTLTKSVI